MFNLKKGKYIVRYLMLRTFLVDLNNVDNLPFEQKLRFSPPNKHLLTEHYAIFGIMSETLVKL
jgi:hypothetical protein